MSFADELRRGYDPDDSEVQRDIERIATEAVGALKALCMWVSKFGEGRTAGGYYSTHYGYDREVKLVYDSTADKFFFMPDPSLSGQDKSSRFIRDEVQRFRGRGLPQLVICGGSYVLTRDQANRLRSALMAKVDELGFTSSVVRLEEGMIPIEYSDGSFLGKMRNNLFGKKLFGFTIYLEASW